MCCQSLTRTKGAAESASPTTTAGEGSLGRCHWLQPQPVTVQFTQAPTPRRRRRRPPQNPPQRELVCDDGPYFLPPLLSLSLGLSHISCTCRPTFFQHYFLLISWAAAAKDAVANTSTRFSTISTTNQTNMSASSPKAYQKKASPLRHGPALSLGGTEGADKGGFAFNPPPYGLQRPWAVASDDNTASLPPQHQQRHIAYPSPSSTFFPHNFLHCGSNDASLVADGGCDQAHDQDNLMHHMHHGQAGVFEAEYFI